MKASILGLFLMAGLILPAAEGKTRKMQNIPSGVWGGPHIRIEFTNGVGTVEYDCATGTIKGPLTLDRNGKFSLSGTHLRETPGPTREDQPRKGQPATFTGWTDGQKMTLGVSLGDSKDEIGNFTLEKGKEGRLWKCR